MLKQLLIVTGLTQCPYLKTDRGAGRHAFIRATSVSGHG